MKNEVSEREKHMRVKNIQGEDYVKIHSVLNEWWGGETWLPCCQNCFCSLSRNEFYH